MPNLTSETDAVDVSSLAVHHDAYRWVSQMPLTTIDVSTIEDAADEVPTAREELEPDDRPPHFAANLSGLFDALLVRLSPLRDRF